MTHFSAAAGTFARIVPGEIAYGIGVGAWTGSPPTAKQPRTRRRSCGRGSTIVPGNCRATWPMDARPLPRLADLRLELIAAERENIYRLLQEGRITDEARRRIERGLDLEEASIASKREGGVETPP